MTVISLARGVPTVDLLPVDAVREAATRTLAADAGRILSYGPGGGYPPLRQALAARHDVEPERIVVVNGSLQGVAFVAEHFARTGRARVALEAPTYDRSLKNFAQRGFAVTSVPLEADGLDVHALAAAPDPALLYTIPTFHNPAGCTLSAQKRTRVADLARAQGLTVYEDDPYSLLRFSGEELPTIFAQAPDHVVWATSFTKTVAPGLRVGYLVLPPALAAEVTALAVDTYISPSFLPQAIVADLLASGAFDASVAHAREQLARRCAALCDALDADLPGASYVRPQGGYFLWVELPEGVHVADVATAAARHEVAFVPGTDFFVAGGERHLRLAFSGLPAEQIPDAVRRLAAAVDDARAAARQPQAARA
jgi:DNA-binding transcriptional MocR family regulator